MTAPTDRKHAMTEIAKILVQGYRRLIQQKDACRTEKEIDHDRGTMGRIEKQGH